MSDPKCGLLGNIWLDAATNDGIVYTPDAPTKKAVGTITITPSDFDTYNYTGLWQDSYLYESGMIVKYNGVMFVAKTSVSPGTLPTSQSDWELYVPQAITIYSVNSDYSGEFNKANASKFMKIFESFLNPWDGTVMIPGIVVSPTNKILAVRSATEGTLDSVVVGFNGIEEYL